MKYHEMTRYLIRLNYRILRKARGSHEIWTDDRGSTILVTRSGLPDRRAKQNWLRSLKTQAT